MLRTLKCAESWMAFAVGDMGVNRAGWAPPISAGIDDWPPAPQISQDPQRVSNSAYIRGGRWVQVAYGLIDVVCICLNIGIAFLLRFVPDPIQSIIHRRSLGLSPSHLLSQYGAFSLLYVALIVLFCQGQDLYRTPRTRSAANESLRVTKAVAYATLVFVAFVFISGNRSISRVVVGLAALFSVFALSGWRRWKRAIVIRRVARGIGARNALIIGAGRIGQALARHLEENKLLGYSFKGFLDSNHANCSQLLGRMEDLARVVRSEFVDDVFITIPSEREIVKQVALEAQRSRLNVKIIPELYDGLGWNAPLAYVGHFPVMELHWQPIPTLGLVVKRIMDVLFSGIGLLLLSPMFVVIGAAIALDTPGPIFYRAGRVGQKGRIFGCVKFRTMVRDADKRKEKLRHLNEREGPFFKIAHDPRITLAGKTLRKYSLDELPQLWNVLKGEMSLVGPRPHPLDDYAHYNLDQLRRLEVKPGITGLWQVTARQDPSFTRSLTLDLNYIENWSLGLDFRILSRTIMEVVRGSGY
jgi:exopolysaccharide biosynthesis polyprenyl glycosylphosphotransferase